MLFALLPLAGSIPLLREAPGLYRPRHPERTVFYRLLEERFEEFATVHEERFERKDGPLRPVVRKAVEAFLACGRPESGFARVRCPDCRAEYLVPSPARPGTSARRASRSGRSSSRRSSGRRSSHRFRTSTASSRSRSPCVGSSLGSAGSSACSPAAPSRRSSAASGRCWTARMAFRGWWRRSSASGARPSGNPHVHSLVTAGLLLRGGELVPLPPMDAELETLLTETYRRLVLDALVGEDRLTEGFREKLLGFGHGGGFSVYGRHLVLNEEPARLAHMARYAVRAPVAMDRVRAGSRRRRRPSRTQASTGRLLPRPDGLGGSRSLPRSRATWARLLRMVFEVDPLRKTGKDDPFAARAPPEEPAA